MSVRHASPDPPTAPSTLHPQNELRAGSCALVHIRQASAASNTSSAAAAGALRASPTPGSPGAGSLPAPPPNPSGRGGASPVGPGGRGVFGGIGNDRPASPPTLASDWDWDADTLDAQLFSFLLDPEES